LCMALDNDCVIPQNVLGQRDSSSDCKGRASKRIKISSRTLLSTSSTSTAVVCTSGTTSVEQPPLLQQQQHLQKRSVIAPTHYSILKRKDLVTLLNKYNIPTHGSVQNMRDRHLAFVTLHNADCDATNPRTYKQLVAEVMRRENQVNYEEQKGRRNGASRDVKCMEKWKQERSSTTATGAVRSGDAKFDQKCKDGFDKLIQHAKKRKQDTDVGEKEQDGGHVHDHKEKEGQETKAVVKHKDDHDVNAACDDSNDSHATATYDPSADDDDEDDDYGGRRMNDAAKRVYEEEDSKPAAKVSVVEDSKPAARRRLDMDHEANHQHQTIIEIDDKIVYTPYATAASHQDDTDANANANTINQDSGFGEYAKYQAAAAPASKNRQSNEKQSPSICGPWQCSICTYLNTTRIWTSAKCEMCDTKRPHGSKLNDGNVAATFLTID